MNDIEKLVADFVAAFERRDAQSLGPYLADSIEFTNYGDATVVGRDAVTAVWGRVFGAFATVRFETLFQASRDQIVLAEQIHHLGLPGRQEVPIHNMALYEIRDGRIAVWKDYSNSTYARQLLAASKPIATP